jgi:hypothetical protein
MKMLKRRNLIVVTFFLCSVLVYAAHASASTVFNVFGTLDNNLSAQVDFGYDPTNSKITVSITNTSDSAQDPYAKITGFAFNVPEAVTGFFAFTASPDPTTPSGKKWHGLYSSNNINTPQPFGSFDMAGITGNNVGGGKPNIGIPINGTYTFTFTLTGTGLDTLTAQSFLGLLSSPKNQNDTPEYFLVRFQATGADGLGSDVAHAPIPPTALLIGPALLGLVGLRKRFIK